MKLVTASVLPRADTLEDSRNGLEESFGEKVEAEQK